MLRGLLAVCFFVLSSSSALRAQSEAAGPLAFDVASVRENKQDNQDTSTNVPLGPGNVYSPTGGLFSAHNFPVLTYIAFAYRMTDNQLEAFRAQAPAWVATTRFNIEGRTEKTDVSKDQLRLMMRALLAERFHLAAHYEPRDKSVYNLLAAKPGITGPALVAHPPAVECPSALPTPVSASAKPPSETVAGGYPATCGGIILLPSISPGNITLGGRAITLSLLAESLAGWGELGRPVVDRTGMTGTYDFVLTYLPPQSDTSASDAIGPTFQQALRQQLGLRLEPAKVPVPILLLDHIDHVADN